jgi:cyclohexadienyl dehydratase
VLLLLALLCTAAAAETTPPASTPPAASPRLRIGTAADYQPFSFAARSGDPKGLDVDIARRLALDLGAPVEFVSFSWTDLLERLVRHDFDIAMSGVTLRPDRAVAGRYTRPYATTGAVVLVRAVDSKRFPSVSEVNSDGVRLAVNLGGHLERIAHARFPRATIEAVADNDSLPQRVLDGRADAAISDSAEVRAWLRPSLRALGPFTTDHKAFLLPPENADLARRVDAWMAERERDGWLDGERRHWLGPAASVDARAATRDAVTALIALRLGLMPYVAAAKRAAHLPVEDLAQEERVIARVRAAASTPERAAALYRQMIDMAKAVQRQSPPMQAGPRLNDLRDAIGRVDEQLLREIDRSPPLPPAAWQAALRRDVDLPGITSAMLSRLAETLARR